MKQDTHPVLPMKKQISLIAAQALGKAIEGTHSTEQILAIGDGTSNGIADAMLEVRHSKGARSKKVDINTLEGLGRVPNPAWSSSKGNFVISKAINIDNLPEKARAN
jgi:hypothetical protein